MSTVCFYVSFQVEAKSAHAMGVLVPWDFHSGEFIQTRISRKAGYGHIGYTLDEIELMFSNVVNAIDDVSRLKAMKPFETLASRIVNEEDGKEFIMVNINAPTFCSQKGYCLTF